MGFDRFVSDSDGTRGPVNLLAMGVERRDPPGKSTRCTRMERDLFPNDFCCKELCGGKKWKNDPQIRLDFNFNDVRWSVGGWH